MLHSVDGQSIFTSEDLVTGLSDLINTYRPAELRTQSDVAGTQFTDHSDHRASGRFAARANQLSRTNLPSGQTAPTITYYIGYPIHELRPNVEGKDLIDKNDAFAAYGAFDGGVCHGMDQCAKSSTYGSYLSRQYTNSY